MSGPDRFIWGGMLALVIGVRVDPASAGSCAPETVRTDTSQAQGSVACFFGKSAGQTFVATDTLIKSISVWRPAGETNPPMKLWITRTDTTGVPITCCDILLNGPTARVPADVGTFKKITYTFDPPFALPEPGLYAFFVQDPCGLVFDVYYNITDNIYPQGHFYRTGRSIYSGCGLSSAGYYQEEEGADLIFEVEFCRTELTATRRTSWGQVKVIYR